MYSKKFNATHLIANRALRPLNFWSGLEHSVSWPGSNLDTACPSFTWRILNQGSWMRRGRRLWWALVGGTFDGQVLCSTGSRWCVGWILPWRDLARICKKMLDIEKFRHQNWCSIWLTLFNYLEHVGNQLYSTQFSTSSETVAVGYEPNALTQQLRVLIVRPLMPSPAIDQHVAGTYVKNSVYNYDNLFHNTHGIKKIVPTKLHLTALSAEVIIWRFFVPGFDEVCECFQSLKEGC